MAPQPAAIAGAGFRPDRPPLFCQSIFRLVALNLNSGRRNPDSRFTFLNTNDGRAGGMLSTAIRACAGLSWRQSLRQITHVEGQATIRKSRLIFAHYSTIYLLKRALA